MFGEVPMTQSERRQGQISYHGQKKSRTGSVIILLGTTILLLSNLAILSLRLLRPAATPSLSLNSSNTLEKEDTLSKPMEKSLGLKR